MTIEQEFFIQVLSDFIRREKTTIIPENIDIECLTTYGKRHELSAILYHQTKIPQFQSAYSSTVYSYANRSRMMQELIDTINAPFFIIKGSAVAELYPIPALRTMGDVDLVVHVGDREKIHTAFLNLGYQNERRVQNEEWKYYKRDMEFELHDRLLYEEVVNQQDQISFFNDCWQYVSQDNRLDWNFHFLFLVAHLRKHFMNEGVGFRQFLDIAVVTKYADLDWGWIEQKANDINLLPFMKTVLSFNSRWFHIYPLIDIKLLDDDFFVEATAKIFEDGVFGFENEENANSVAVNLYWKKGKIAQIIHALQQIFPPYNAMVSVPHYNWLTGKPLLLPIAWIYRVFKGRKNSKGILANMKKAFAATEVISKREAMYRQWGL